MHTQYVLSYRIDLFFMIIVKLTIKIDQNGHGDRNINYETKKQKEREQKFGFKFIRINPDKEDFDIFRTISETVTAYLSGYTGRIYFRLSYIFNTSRNCYKVKR